MLGSAEKLLKSKTKNICWFMSRYFFVYDYLLFLLVYIQNLCCWDLVGFEHDTKVPLTAMPYFPKA
jgi:hypothetical protein